MCGIIGVYNSPEAVRFAIKGLFAEQHRGQESCGIATSNGNDICYKKGHGLVKDFFTDSVVENLKGHIAIGHVRYPTKGGKTINNSSPHVLKTLSGLSYALVSNGDVVNYKEIRNMLEKKNVLFESENDGELLLKFIVYYIEKENYSIVNAIKKLFKDVKGAYSTLLITKNEMFLFRDVYAVRPLCYCKTEEGSFVIASESVALDIVNPVWKKEVGAGAIIQFSENKDVLHPIDISEFRSSKYEKHCIFEHIYFSRPDSVVFGEKVFDVRKKIGAFLAKDEPDVDLVVPVPDSAIFFALGYAKEINKPFELGLIRNHYVGRTFIKPEQTVRDESVNQKFNVLPGVFKDKKVLLIDDSVVRGTTLKKIVLLIKKAGAKEVHVRLGCPPIKFPCFYGIDTPYKNKLIANNKNLEEIKEALNVDSLGYLDINDLDKSVKKPNHYCKACFTGKYPIESDFL